MNEIPWHGDDVVPHELHVKQHLVDGDLVKLPLRHDQKGDREAQKKKNDEGANKAERKLPIPLHSTTAMFPALLTIKALSFSTIKKRTI